MVLTSRINLSVGINTLGHRMFFEELFSAMGFTKTQLTFSGLRWMWKKKEYGRIYRSLKSMKRHRRLAKRKRMKEGTDKMEQDTKACLLYTSDAADE